MALTTNIVVGLQSTNTMKIGNYGDNEATAIDVGLIKGGVHIEYEEAFHDVKIDQAIGSIDKITTDETLKVKTTLAEATLENLATALGYKTTDVTEGKYGGRSRQEVINQLLNTGSHSIDDYISENEKDSYNASDLFDSTIGGTAKESKDCKIDIRDRCECLESSSTLDNPLDNIYDEITYTPREYGGFCSENNNTIVSQNDTSYKPMLKKYSNDNN
ncbi:MAG: hypothetical protein HOB19_02125, partial [Elusimicrobiaceae bacterium]|nr:hypothetical protein [Elusimicrobiaceae bacterium]